MSPVASHRLTCKASGSKRYVLQQAAYQHRLNKHTRRGQESAKLGRASYLEPAGTVLSNNIDKHALHVLPACRKPLLHSADAGLLGSNAKKCGHVPKVTPRHLTHATPRTRTRTRQVGYTGVWGHCDGVSRSWAWHPPPPHDATVHRAVLRQGLEVGQLTCSFFTLILPDTASFRNLISLWIFRLNFPPPWQTCTQNSDPASRVKGSGLFADMTGPRVARQSVHLLELVGFACQPTGSLT